MKCIIDSFQSPSILFKRDIDTTNLIIYLHFVLVIFLFQSCKPVNYETDLAKGNEQGKVKSILLLSETYDRYSGRLKNVPSESSEYNDFGFITKWEIYSPQGELQTVVDYFYDSRNYCIRMKSYNPKGSFPPGFETFYTYNLKGLPAKDIERSISDSRDRTTTTYKYDRRGNVTETVEKEIDDTFIEKFEYVYGNRGLKAEEKVYYNNELAQFHSFSYNLEGQLIQSKKIDYKRGGDENNYSISHYDIKGNTVRYESYKNGRVNSAHENTYDGFNNMTREYMHSPGSELDISHKYHFDRFNNWVRKSNYSNGKLNSTYVREIEYY